MRSRISIICLGSRPTVGSSRMTIFGSPSRAWAMPHALAVALGEVLDEPVRDVAYLRDGHDALHLLCELGPAQALRPADEGEIFPRRPVHVERRLLRQIAQQPLRRARLLKDVVPVDFHLA